ncbi:MAG: hypothetical protein TEF_03450 [Rhizobiales bacterium NRL2]|jgi:glyoxylase-like metal-dependent hydrolase (beta-lactamase superfamily II)|nr:MAG: hypothetical protein TEF_03450 [Rhizobiales bacterium NRL2]
MTTDNWRIGNVRITRIMELKAERTPDFGYTELTTDDILRETWLKPHFATEEGKLISCIQAFVVESEGRRIIVDTCVGNDKERGNPAWNMLAGPFLDDLRAAGHPAEAIDTVLCTHLHVDHVGWNTMKQGDRWVPTFPNARYLFGRLEWEHWSREATEVIRGDMPVDVVEGVVDARRTNRDSVRPIVEAGLHELVETDHRVTGEIRLEPTPGHTPGHVSVVIESEGERAVITGDLMHHPIQCAMPHVASRFDHDIKRARATREDFLRRYADGPVTVFGTHFAPPTAGRVISHDGGWRFSVE